jgi:hypothetical protein
MMAEIHTSGLTSGFTCRILHQVTMNRLIDGSTLLYGEAEDIRKLLSRYSLPVCFSSVSMAILHRFCRRASLTDDTDHCLIRL